MSVKDILPKGEDYEQLGETYIIFITENDVWGENRPLYNIERCLLPECRQVNDGAHILYVNASIQDDTALGRLMHDMFCRDPKKMYYKDLSERVDFLKSAEGGFELMCELSEKLISFGEEKGEVKGSMKKSREVAVNMLRKGLSITLIEECTKITKTDIIALAKEQGIKTVE